MKKKLKNKEYLSNRNEIHRSISGFTPENFTEKEVKDLLDFALQFILQYTPNRLGCCKKCRGNLICVNSICKCHINLTN